MSNITPEQQAQDACIAALLALGEYRQSVEQSIANLLVTTVVTHNASRGVETLQVHKRVKSGDHNYIVAIARIEL